MAGKRSLWVDLLVLLGYGLLTAVMTWPLVTHFTAAIPGDSFDGWQNYWNLWWLKVALVERIQNPYQTDLLYYPTGVGLYFHTLNPFNGVSTLPVQLSLGLIPAYNTVVFLSWVLGGYGVYLLVLWLLGNRYWQGATGDVLQQHTLAAFLAGTIFTFSPFHMAHLLGHMQVMALQWIPFYVLYLLRALAAQENQRGWVRSALWAGFYLALAGWCDLYFVLYLLFFTGLVILWRWGSRWRAGRVEAPLAPLYPPLISGTFFLLLFAPLLLPMVSEALQFSFMVRPVADLYIFSASLLDFFVPNRLHPLFLPESLTWIGNQVAPPSEHTVSLGYLPVALALLGLRQDRKRTNFWLISALFFMLLALGPRLHLGNITAADIPTGNEMQESWTPYAVLNRLVPFMRISRSVSRYALLVQLSVAVLAGLGLAAWWRARPPEQSRQRLLVTSGLLLVILAEFWVAPFPLSPPDTPAFYSQLRDQPGSGAVLNLPMNYDRPGYLLYQTVHQRPLTVGYISRDDPRTLTERAPVLQQLRHLGPDILADNPAQVGQTVLHDLGVDLVVLDRYKMPGGLEREYPEQLAAAIFAGQTPVYEDERLTVYPVQAPVTPQPYLLLGELHWGPLQTDPAGQRSRGLLGEAALLYLRHAPTNAQLHVRYRTLADSGLQVEGGATPLTLPAAPTGNEVTIPLADESQVVQLIPTRPNAVWIEKVELQVSQQ